MNVATNGHHPTTATPNVADEFADLFETLTAAKRRSTVQFLSDAFYLNDFPPTRADVAALLEALPCVSGRRRLRPVDPATSN